MLVGKKNAPTKIVVFWWMEWSPVDLLWITSWHTQRLNFKAITRSSGTCFAGNELLRFFYESLGIRSLTLASFPTRINAYIIYIDTTAHTHTHIPTYKCNQMYICMPCCHLWLQIGRWTWWNNRNYGHSSHQMFWENEGYHLHLF